MQGLWQGKHSRRSQSRGGARASASIDSSSSGSSSSSSSSRRSSRREAVQQGGRPQGAVQSAHPAAQQPNTAHKQRAQYPTSEPLAPSFLNHTTQVHRAICKPLQAVIAVKKMNLESLNCDLVSPGGSEERQL